MRFRHFLSSLFLVFLVSADAFADPRLLLPITVGAVATGAPESQTFRGLRSSAAYLVVTTSSELATSSLAVTVTTSGDASGNVLVCTVPAITTETQTVTLIGVDRDPAEGVDANCPFPLGRDVTLTFTVTGADGGFTIVGSLNPIDVK